MGLLFEARFRTLASDPAISAGAVLPVELVATPLQCGERAGVLSSLEASSPVLVPRRPLPKDTLVQGVKKILGQTLRFL